MSDEILEFTVEIYQSILLTVDKGSVDVTVEINTSEDFEVAL